MDFTACHLGYAKADTLEEACEKLSSRASFRENFANMRYAGCRIFDNEADAREAYG